MPLEVTLRMGAEGDGPQSFADLRGLAADEMGRIYVLEHSIPEIRIYDSTGALVAKVGRRGEGPGEFLDPVGLALDPSGDLWTVDQGASRIFRFTHDARYLSSVPRGFSGSNVDWWRGRLDDQGRWIDVLESPGQVQGTMLLRSAPSQGGPPERSAIPPYVIPAFELARKNSWTRATVPFSPRLVWTVDRRGDVWTGTSDRYFLVKRSFAGDTLARAEHAYPAPRVSDKEREEAVKGLEWFTKQGGKVDAGKIPGQKPLFRELSTDDQGRLWVQLNTSEGASNTLFDVFSATGQFLARVGGPLGQVVYPPLIVHGNLYAVALDSSGVPQVVRARVPPLK